MAMVAQVFVLLKLVTNAVKFLAKVTVIFVETYFEKLLNYVMMETVLTDKVVLLIACLYSLHGPVQGDPTPPRMSVFQNTKMDLLLGLSNVMIITQSVQMGAQTQE